MDHMIVKGQHHKGGIGNDAAIPARVGGKIFCKIRLPHGKQPVDYLVETQYGYRHIHLSQVKI
jgi:hypothetical protein